MRLGQTGVPRLEPPVLAVSSKPSCPAAQSASVPDVAEWRSEPCLIQGFRSAEERGYRLLGNGTVSAPDMAPDMGQPDDGALAGGRRRGREGLHARGILLCLA